MQKFKRRLVDFLSIEYWTQYSMERKSTKRRLTGRRTQSGYKLKVRELFESIFRVIMIFFLAL